MNGWEGAVLGALTVAQGPLTVSALVNLTGAPVHTVEAALGALEAAGDVRRAGTATNPFPEGDPLPQWELAGSPLDLTGHRDREDYDPRTGNWHRTCIRDGQVTFWHLGRNDPPPREEQCPGT